MEGDREAPIEPARPAPRVSLSEWCRRTLDWIGPQRLIGGVMLASGIAVGGWWLLHAPPPPVERSLPTAVRTPTTLGAAPAPSSSSVTPPPSAVVVHVAGAVLHPGLVTLPSTARVDDAVTAAGGADVDADLDALNLAALVADGARIYVPRRGEVVPAVVSSGAPPPSGPVDVNSASEEQLDALPGIGPTTAAAIVAHRQANGPFRTVDDLLEVRGIGEAKLEQFRALVTG